jgi:hypothetical protein
MRKGPCGPIHLRRRSFMVKREDTPCRGLRNVPVILGIMLSAYLLSGCATVPYSNGQDIERPNTLNLRPNEPQIERGRPNRFIDGLGHFVLSIPSKVLLLNWHVDNHNISQTSEDMLKRYLADNDLHNVKVRLNQYAPGAEWSRLFRNRSVGAGWRFTLGIISLMNYTIFPGRLFGGDEYNPYTNTIHLYSDHSAIALHEAGHAKDFTERKYKGSYSALRMLPLVPLYQEALATGDAIGYFREKELAEEEKNAYKILYPAYGTYVGGEAFRWVQWWVDLPPWAEYAVRYGSAIPGHILGRGKAFSVDRKSRAKSHPNIESSGQSCQR